MNYILDTVFKIAQLDVFHLFTKAKLVETFQCMYYFFDNIGHLDLCFL